MFHFLETTHGLIVSQALHHGPVNCQDFIPFLKSAILKGLSVGQDAFHENPNVALWTVSSSHNGKSQWLLAIPLFKGDRHGGEAGGLGSPRKCAE